MAPEMVEGIVSMLRLLSEEKRVEGLEIIKFQTGEDAAAGDRFRALTGLQVLEAFRLEQIGQDEDKV